MRHFLPVVLYVGLIAVCPHSAQAGQPSITVSYSPSFDSACSFWRGGTIKDE
jgi:hypothetical protein